MLPLKDNNSPITKFRGMEFCNLTNKEFTMVVWKKLKELQENPDNSMKVGKKKSYENEIFTKETVIIKKILKLRNSMN